MALELIAMKEEYELARNDYKQAASKTARSGIAEELRKLNQKIVDEERRLNSQLEKVNINNIEYELPNNFGYFPKDERYTYEVKDGCLYRYEKMKLDSDGAFHLHHYVWIPQTTNKYVKLCVRVLGGDYHGERFYLTASYFKHPSDNFSYMSKEVRTDNYNYKPYYLYIIDRTGFKHKKDKWHTNLLEWKKGENK
jgi:hypothetical protein